MYQKILVPLDGSATAQLALAHAAQLARLNGAAVQLLHIVDAMEHITGFEPPAVHIGDVRPRFLKAGQDLLAAAQSQLSAQGIAVQTTLLAAAANACPNSSPTRPLGKRPIWSSWARMAGAASSAC